MTRRVDDVPRHRGLHLLDWQLRRDRARAVRQEPTMDATTYAMTPAGRRQLRGIPCVGTGGLDERRNPLLEVLDRERDAAKEASRQAVSSGASAIHSLQVPELRRQPGFP